MKVVIKIVCLAVVPMLLSAGVEAQTLKIATLAPAGTTWMKEMEAGADLIRQRTDDRVRFKFYPGGVMGNDQSVHRKIKIGQLQGGAFSAGGLAHVDSSIQVLGLPMLFSSFDEVDYVRERIDPVMKQRLEDNGFVALGITEGGFSRIFSKQPMQNLESLRGSKVWLPEGDRITQIVYDALGISPISLPIADVYTGLQTGLIETITTNPTSAIAFQWHTGTAYMTDVPLSYLIGVMAVEKKAYDRLSAEDRAIVREEMGKVFERLDRINREDNRAARDALENHGITFVNPTPEEARRWRDIAGRSIEAIVAEGLISRDIVDQVRSYLDSFRGGQ